MRRHLRFTRYLPVQCTVLRPEEAEPRPLTGITRNVNAGGLEILLSEALPAKTLVSVRVAGSDPVPGYVVSCDKGIPTPMGTKYPHGVAFEEPVEPAIVRQWVSQSEKRAHPRIPVHFDVKYTLRRKKAHGVCLNLSKGGMFIATERPAPLETDLMFHFTLPGEANPFAVRARVTWVSREDAEPDAIAGMGVRFLELSESDALAIGTFVNQVSTETPGPDSS